MRAVVLILCTLVLVHAGVVELDVGVPFVDVPPAREAVRIGMNGPQMGPMVFAPMHSLSDDAAAPPRGGEVNLRPIIGVLTQPTFPTIAKWGSELIVGSYVKYLEAAGARVVPVSFTSTDEELDAIFEGLNGFFFPGGNVDTNHTPFFYAGERIFQRIVAINEAGHYFPLLGHCMGLEQIMMYVSGNSSILTAFDAENISLPLKFTSDAPRSRLWGTASESVVKTLSRENCTMNFHEWGVSPADFEDNVKLATSMRILSTSLDKQGRTFISSAEGTKLPLYALQYHPEKPIYEWAPDEALDHSLESVRAMHHTASVLVADARRNTRKYASAEVATQYLIYNTPQTYVYDTYDAYEIAFFFK